MSLLTKTSIFLSFRFAVSKVVRHISFGHYKLPFHENKHERDTPSACSWPTYKNLQLVWIVFYRDLSRQFSQFTKIEKLCLFFLNLSAID